MQIRPAKISDSKSIASLLMLAMGGVVFEFIRSSDINSAKSFLTHFVELPKNQYSFENCLIAEVDNRVVGVVNFYDGAQLDVLLAPVAEYIKTHFNPDFNPEPETQAGEIYLDCIAVSPDQQGQGVGKKLLEALIEKCASENSQKLGLLVSMGNTKAKKLYLNLGFKPVGVKTIVGFQMEHLQLITNGSLLLSRP